MTKKTELAKTEEPQFNLSSIQEKSEQMQKMVDGIKVTTPDELNCIAEKIKNIKTLGAHIKKEKEKLTKPAQAIINEARAKYLPFEKMCVEAERQLKTKAGIYMDGVEAERKVKEAKIAKRVDAGTLKEDTGIKKLDEIGDEKKTVSTGTAELQKRTVQKVEIVDREKIPHEYWIVDEVKVRKVALAGVAIPGVEVKEVSQISIS